MLNEDELRKEIGPLYDLCDTVLVLDKKNGENLNKDNKFFDEVVEYTTMNMEKFEKLTSNKKLSIQEKHYLFELEINILANYLRELLDKYSNCSDIDTIRRLIMIDLSQLIEKKYNQNKLKP